VLDSPGYRAVAGDNYSPWTKRIMPRVRLERLIGERVEADAGVLPTGARLLVLEFSGNGRAEADQVREGLGASFSQEPGYLGSRVATLTVPEAGGVIAVAGFSGTDVPPL